jgi:hypothetical protein
VTIAGSVPPAAAEGTPAQPGRPKRGYWIPAVIAMVVLLAIAAAVGAGDLDHSAPTKLPGSEVASEVALGLQVQTRSSGPPDVTCPPSEPVRAGFHFECTLSSGATRRAVDIVEIDGRGRLRWHLGGEAPTGSPTGS